MGNTRLNFKQQGNKGSSCKRMKFQVFVCRGFYVHRSNTYCKKVLSTQGFQVLMPIGTMNKWEWLGALSCVAWKDAFWHVPTSDPHGFTFRMQFFGGPDSAADSPWRELSNGPGGAWVPALFVGGSGFRASKVGKNKVLGFSFPREPQPRFWFITPQVWSLLWRWSYQFFCFLSPLNPQMYMLYFILFIMYICLLVLHLWLGQDLSWSFLIHGS